LYNFGSSAVAGDVNKLANADSVIYLRGQPTVSMCGAQKRLRHFVAQKYAHAHSKSADSRGEIRPRVGIQPQREEVNKSKAAVIIIYYIKSTCVYISNSRWEKYLCAGF